MLWQPKLTDQDIGFAIEILRSNDSVSHVWQKARFFAEQAKQNLRTFRHSRASDALSDLADYVVNNVHDARHAQQNLFLQEDISGRSQMAHAAGESVQ